MPVAPGGKFGAPYLYLMRRFRLLIAAGLIACSGSEATGPPESLAEGTWIGAITGDAQEGTLEWKLTDTGGAIGG